MGQRNPDGMRATALQEGISMNAAWFRANRTGPMSRQSSTPITARNRVIFDFILDFIREHQMSPTVREIMEGIGIASPNGVVCYLVALENKGYIQTADNKSRGIRVVGTVCECCRGLGVKMPDRPSSEETA